MTLLRRSGRTMTIRASVMASVVALTLVTAGCAGSSEEADTGPTTSFPYLIDPVEPGSGFLQLGENRYVFDGVICVTGPVESDPEGSTRRFGVYANFEVDGVLAAIALTRYHNQESGAIETIPTLTDTALIQMQGDGEVRGLAATRFQVEGEKNWQDRNDPNATTPLITRVDDRYEAKGFFGPVGADVASATTVAGGPLPDADVHTPGQVVARCPDPNAPTSTIEAPTTQPADTTSLPPTPPTAPPFTGEDHS